MNKQKNRFGTFDIVNGIILFMIVLACLYPFYYIFLVSISDGNLLQLKTPVFRPLNSNVEAFKFILTNPRIDVVMGLKNSIVFTFLGTVVAVLVTYTTAFVLSRKCFTGRYFILSLFIFTWVFNAGTVPVYIFLDMMHLINNPLVMIIPGAINVQFLIITKAYLDSVPIQLEEAAVIDGANYLQIMTRIYMPISKTILATVGTFYAVAKWNEYLGPKIWLQDKSLYTIQLVLQQLVIDPGDSVSAFGTFTQNNILLTPDNLKASSVVIAMIPILLVYPFVQKFFKQGVMIGSVKE